MPESSNLRQARSGRLRVFIVAGMLLLLFSAASKGDDSLADFTLHVRPFLAKYCFQCHSEGDPSASIDLKSPQSSDEIDAAYESFRNAVRAITEQRMPPEDEAKPSPEERAAIEKWYKARFVDNVVARPGPHRPRRLSAREYRNTLRTLFGFDLLANVALAEDTVAETSLVLKLLPTDPPGPSRYRNDTYSNPLSSVAWDSYSQLADSAIEELFSTKRKANLELLSGKVEEAGFSISNAERLLREFYPRALRRPVAEDQVRAAIERVKMASDLVDATRFELKALLMSPGFLYRGLLMETQPGKTQAVDDFELAERLSYFLWADMPDRELSNLAASGQLKQSETLRQQTERMLNSPKATNLAEDWAVQWLLLDNIVEVSTDVPFVVALKSQPIDFIHYLISEDRPILELVDSKVEFINVLTARYYDKDRKQLAPYSRPKGIENEIVPNQKIQLIETSGRGGILTMPGLLAMNRGPIIRGTWILERILGEFLPDPPANVGQVRANKEGETLTFRQRFEQHRAQSTCAICHDKIDPLGFVLESYDPNGALMQNLGSIDTSGNLPSGEAFANVDELKRIFVSSQSETVVRNVVVQLLSYALCRKLEFYDQPVVDEITQLMLKSQGTYRQLIHAIVNSLPFRETVAAGVSQ
ncbi:MAG: DUF1592 domain-containing protein [Pirellulaceae bacterium]|nr:DUF1592 domain-containing protein [Pirellulaceae bacterium]